MQLFFNSDITKTSKEIVFTKEESLHIVKVLRKQKGDILDLTNGKGYFFKAELNLINQKNA